MNSPKDTGFHCYYSKLYVGDILSIYSGAMGFAIVAEDENGFLLETYDAIAGRPTGKTELRLDHNISNSYLKVDPANPFGPPRFEITCSQCMETVIGYSSADGEAVEWTSDCGEKRQQRVARTVYLGDDETEEYEDFEYSGLCKACMADPSRTSRTRRLREYAARRYKEESLDVTTSNFCAFSQKRMWRTGLMTSKWPKPP